jgi:hypothetical protein
VRFETALAVMILVDFRLRRDRGEVEPFKEDRSVANVVMPVEILATLAPYMRPPPSPTALLTSPHEQLSGSRHLSRWYAAQLLDGAVLRVLSYLDRVITMLHLRALLPIEVRKDGTIRLPSFERTALRRLRPAYQHSPDWAPFRAIADNAIYKLMKRFRDGTVHHRRWPSELHGEKKQIAYWDSGGRHVVSEPLRSAKGSAPRITPPCCSPPGIKCCALQSSEAADCSTRLRAHLQAMRVRRSRRRGSSPEQIH